MFRYQQKGEAGEAGSDNECNLHIISIQLEDGA